jgi:alpha-galactosidase
MLHARFDSSASTLLLELSGDGPPQLAWFGARLPPDDRRPAPRLPPRGSMPDAPVPASLFPTGGLGWLGPVALEGTDLAGRMLVPQWQTVANEARVDRLISRLVAASGDQVELELVWGGDTGVMRAATRLTAGAEGLRLSRLASLVLPLPDWASELMVFDGRWIAEGHPHRFAAPPGAWERTNRTGRTGFPGATLLVGEPGFAARSGACIGVHLAWSGSHRLRVETTPDRQRLVLVEALLEPGEIVLGPGEVFEAPAALAVWSGAGIDGISRQLHAFGRQQVLPRTPLPAPGGTHRPVHFNTWEAVYFDLDEARLTDLARAAAALGCERFVLDDGWFAGRRDDRAGLGDWTPDPVRFPRGLGPLIASVEAQGMAFGLWLEPEMVNPDSDLARAHPDWILGAGGPQPTMRNQLVLDLALPPVRAHLFETIRALLAAHPIGYIKWDFNRDLFPPTRDGMAVSHRRTQALLMLLDEVRAAFPQVQIETCSSGGARLDLGILARTHRVWPSDNTDPLSRLRILRWQALASPLEVLGSHVAGNPNPSSGRSHPMGLRCAVALFGWMGVEADPGRLAPDEQATLRRAIALWKDWRAELGAPELVRLPGRGLMQRGADLAVALVDCTADPALPGLEGVAGVWTAWQASDDLAARTGLGTHTGAELAARGCGATPVWEGLALVVLHCVPS